MGDENRRAVEQLIDGLNRGDVSVMDEVFHDDAIMEWPQSRERIRGRSSAERCTRASRPSRRSRRGGSWWRATSAWRRPNSTTMASAYDCVFIFELRDGRIAKETAYWSQPFEAPAWRADLVERM